MKISTAVLHSANEMHIQIASHDEFAQMSLGFVILALGADLESKDGYTLCKYIANCILMPTRRFPDSKVSPPIYHSKKGRRWTKRGYKYSAAGKSQVL